PGGPAAGSRRGRHGRSGATDGAGVPGLTPRRCVRYRVTRARAGARGRGARRGHQARRGQHHARRRVRRGRPAQRSSGGREREPELYGRTTLAEIEARTRERARALGIDVSWTQTNHEGELVEAIQRLKGKADGLVLNAAAYTHTSPAVRDALLAVRVPFVEVHLSNLFAREPERRRSLLADAAVGMVTGFGADSYRLGLEGLVGYLQARHDT